MNIFITGGTGFVGSHLTHKLVYAGHEVTVGGLDPQETVVELPPNVETVHCDVTDPDTLDFSGFDAVIHLVGLSPLKQPVVPYEKVHVEGTENVLDECGVSNVSRYLHMSALGADPEANTEYLKTKGEAQRLVEESDLEWTVFRPSVIFGEGGQFLGFTEKLLTPLLTFLPGGGRNQFQPIYVEDIGDLFVEAVENPEHIHETYDIGGPEKLSMAEISRRIERSKGRKLKVVPLPMTAVKFGAAVSEYTSILPFGKDQYRSLKHDNTVEDNSIERFDKSTEEFLTLEKYLEQ